MIGVLVSSKTLRGEPDQWPHRYPGIQEIAGIFSGHPNAYNVIHYSTDDPGSLLDQLLTAGQWGGPELHGFQLNMAWPSAEILERFSRQMPGQQLILQLNQKAFRMSENQGGGIVTKLKQEYSGLIHHVLLDLSAGYGRLLDPAWARRQLQEMQDADLGLGLGVAGGLSPTSLHLLGPLVKDFPQVSIDAEGRLRDGDDKLDLPLAQNYMRMALTMFQD